MWSVFRSAAALTLITLVLAGCGDHKQAPQAAADGSAGAKVLNLYIWSDYLAPNTLADFEKQTGIKVHVAYYDSN